MCCIIINTRLSLNIFKHDSIILISLCKVGSTMDPNKHIVLSYDDNSLLLINYRHTELKLWPICYVSLFFIFLCKYKKYIGKR